MDVRNDVNSDSDSSSSWVLLTDSSISFVSGKDVHHLNSYRGKDKTDTSSSSEIESDTDGISTLSENEPSLENRDVVQKLTYVPKVKKEPTNVHLTKVTYCKQFGLGIIFVAVLFGSIGQFMTERATVVSFDGNEHDKIQVSRPKVNKDDIVERNFDKIVDLTIFCNSKFKKNNLIKRCVESYLGSFEEKAVVDSEIVSAVSENEEIEVKVVKKLKREKNVNLKGEKSKGFKKIKNKKNGQGVNGEWYTSKIKKRVLDDDNWLFDRAFIRCKKRNKTFWHYKRVEEQRHSNPSFTACSS